MIVSKHALTASRCWLHAGILLLAFALLPFGVAFAQRGDDAGGEVDVSAALERIGITDEGAVKIREHLGNKGLSEDQIDQVLRGFLRIVPAIKNGGDEAMFERIENHLVNRVGLEGPQVDVVLRMAKRLAGAGGEVEEKRLDVVEIVEKLKPVFTEHGFSDEQVGMVKKVMLRLVIGIEEQGEDFELNERLDFYLVEHVGLGDEQIEVVIEIAHKIAAVVSGKDPVAEIKAFFERIEPVLEEHGFSEEQIELSFEAIAKIVFTIREQDGSFSLEPEMEEYLWNELRLSEEQIELLVKLSQRISLALEKKQAGQAAEAELKGLFERIGGMLEQDGFTEEQIKKVFGVMKKIIAAVQKQGDDFELDPELEAYLWNEIRLSEDQIDLVVALSQRIGLGMKQKQGGDLAATFERVGRHLADQGLTVEQIEMVFGAMKKMIPAIQKAGGEYELHPKLEEYLWNEVRLSEEQIELVVGVAKRVAMSLEKQSDGNELGGYLKRVEAVLAEHGLDEGQIEQVSNVMKRLVAAVQKNGVEILESDRVVNHLANEIGLTDEQIELVVRLAHRIVGATAGERSNQESSKGKGRTVEGDL